MKIALMQKSFVCADVLRNSSLIVETYQSVKKEGVSLLITPYFALTGLPLFDLLLHDFIFAEVEKAVQKLLKLQDMAILVSYPHKKLGQVYARQVVIYNGEFIYQQDWLLQDDKLQYCSSARFKFNEVNFQLIYSDQTYDYQIGEGIDLILYQSNEPFYDSIQDTQFKLSQKIISDTSTPVLMINPLGTNDQYLYAGASFLLSKHGNKQFQAGYFQEQDYILVWDGSKGFTGKQEVLYEQRIELLYYALIFGMQGYFYKNHFQKICLGLSGGIDSALVLALAEQAIGVENCEVLLMPSQYTSDMSNELAIQMLRNLNITYSVMSISEIFNQYKQVLAPRFAGLAEDTTEENIQARIRGVLLMALSNKTGAILLCTGNKSEEAVGYSTLYGDTNGGFAPIKDLYKTEVYEMARWINAHFCSEIIPQGIIDRKPSAELKFDQTDQDSLPEYELLDAILKLILEDQSLEQIVEQGYAQDVVKQVMRLVRNSEFKRQQGVLGPKISTRSFGREWNYPITRLPNFY